MITNPDSVVISGAPTGHLHYRTSFGLLFLEDFSQMFPIFFKMFLFTWPSILLDTLTFLLNNVKSILFLQILTSQFITGLQCWSGHGFNLTCISLLSTAKHTLSEHPRYFNTIGYLLIRGILYSQCNLQQNFWMLPKLCPLDKGWLLNTVTLSYSWVSKLS